MYKTGTSIYQPRPTSATRNIRPAAFNDSTDLSFSQRSSSSAHLRLDLTSYRHHPSNWRPNTTATDFIPTINRHFCCICHLAFVPFIVFGCHYSHALNLKHLRGRHTYRLRNKSFGSRWSRKVERMMKNWFHSGRIGWIILIGWKYEIRDHNSQIN